MRYRALASDYDGTLAHHGRIDAPTRAALERLKASGRKLILVTGRHLEDLLEVFPEHSLCDSIVAENGGLLYNPRTQEGRVLAAPPPPEFIEHLRARGVTPLAVGRAIVATWEPHAAAVQETIRALQLALQVILNKGAVMVLPIGIDKASGLRAALDTLGLSPHDVIGIGDAENDRVMLDRCGCGVAVANALAALKQHADWVTTYDHGAGVGELIDHVLRDDLRSIDAARSRR